jgi:hypothetical protein
MAMFFYRGYAKRYERVLGKKRAKMESVSIDVLDLINYL